MKLKSLLNESTKSYKRLNIGEEEEEKRMTSEEKKAFLEAVSAYKKFGETIYRNGDLMETYTAIKGIVENANKVTLEETGDWFDRVTVNRHMKSMNESFKVFQKTLTEVHTLQQRLESTYDEIGEVLSKYYEIKEGNEFGAERAKAIAKGEDEFEVDGKTYKVSGDTSDEKAQAKKESMFDDIIDEMLSEEIEGTSVEEAEVVMAVRALADDIQDHVERLGRMVNEDIPAIADQMIHEFGADKAAQFKESAEQTLSTALESAKQAKDGVNELVGSITGEDMGLMGGADDMGSIEDPIGADSPIDDMGVEELPEPEIDVNEPAAAGPEEEPLGRAPVEV